MIPQHNKGVVTGLCPKAVNASSFFLQYLIEEPSPHKAGAEHTTWPGKLYPGVPSAICPWHRKGTACLAFNLLNEQGFHVGSLDTP